MEQFLLNDLMNTLFEKINYEVKKENEVVFYQGDTGKKFYIVIEGEVIILEEQTRCNHQPDNTKKTSEGHKANVLIQRGDGESAMVKRQCKTLYLR